MRTRKLKFYISGQITGMPGNNKEAFDKMAEKVRGMGFHAISPLDGVDKMKRCRYIDYITRDLRILDRCDGIVMIPGWNKSPGAVVEHHYAVGRGKVVIMGDCIESYDAEKIMKEYSQETLHCSDCMNYEPCCPYMYCKFLKRRITARKTPKNCKGYKNKMKADHEEDNVQR